MDQLISASLSYTKYDNRDKCTRPSQWGATNDICLITINQHYVHMYAQTDKQPQGVRPRPLPDTDEAKSWNTQDRTRNQPFIGGTSSSRHHLSAETPPAAPRSVRPSQSHSPARATTIIRSHTSYHPIVELLDDCYHQRWYPDAGEYLPQEGTFNGVVRLLEIYQAHEERHSCLPPNFLQPA